MDIIQNTNIETTLPTLALIAGSDKVVNPQKALNLFNIFSKQTTKINIYKDSYHELFHDINRNEVFSDIRDWLNS